MQLMAIIRKELRLLGRDAQGLALLFLMPVIFILIMSLAMKDDFDRRAGIALTVLVEDGANNARSTQMLEDLAVHDQFELHRLADVSELPPGNIRDEFGEQAVGSDQYHFLLRIHSAAFEDPEVTIADLLVAPATSQELALLFAAAVKEAAAGERIALMLDELKAEVPDLADVDLLARSRVDDDLLLSVRYGFQAGDNEQAPTAVQQNVPAWLVFSMFFVVVPLANALINERQLGTLRRMRTVPVANWKLLIGKVVPYFVINQIQVVLMLLVGFYVVPALGGDQLTLGNSYPGLALIAAALSIAALGYAMLIAVVCRSTEQATTLGGATNIILAALGGIMVPTFIMPEFMQTLSHVSPMSWGLQGFLDIFSRGGGVQQVWSRALALFALGACAMALALYFMNRQTD